MARKAQLASTDTNKFFAMGQAHNKLCLSEVGKMIAKHQHQHISWEMLRSIGANVFDLVDHLPSFQSMQDTVEFRHVVVNYEAYEENPELGEAITTAHLDTPLELTLNANIVVVFTSMKLILNTRSGIRVLFVGSHKTHKLFPIHLESLPDQSGFIMYEPENTGNMVLQTCTFEKQHVKNLEEIVQRAVVVFGMDVEQQFAVPQIQFCENSPVKYECRVTLPVKLCEQQWTCERLLVTFLQKPAFDAFGHVIDMDQISISPQKVDLTGANPFYRLHGYSNKYVLEGIDCSRPFEVQSNPLCLDMHLYGKHVWEYQQFSPHHTSTSVQFFAHPNCWLNLVDHILCVKSTNSVPLVYMADMKKKAQWQYCFSENNQLLPIQRLLEKANFLSSIPTGEIDLLSYVPKEYEVEMIHPAMLQLTFLFEKHTDMLVLVLDFCTKQVHFSSKDSPKVVKVEMKNALVPLMTNMQKMLSYTDVAFEM